MTVFDHVLGAFDVPSASLGVWERYTCSMAASKLAATAKADSGNTVSLLLPLSAPGVWQVFVHMTTADGRVVLPAFQLIAGDAAATAGAHPTYESPPGCPGAPAQPMAVLGVDGYTAGDPAGEWRKQPPGVVSPPSAWGVLEWDLAHSDVFAWDTSGDPYDEPTVVMAASALAPCLTGASDATRAACAAHKLVLGLRQDALVRARTCAAAAMVQEGMVASCYSLASALGAAAYEAVGASQDADLAALLSSGSHSVAQLWEGAHVDQESVLQQAMAACGGGGVCGNGCVHGAVAQYMRGRVTAGTASAASLGSLCDALTTEGPLWMACVSGTCHAGRVWAGVCACCDCVLRLRGAGTRACGSCVAATLRLYVHHV